MELVQLIDKLLEENNQLKQVILYLLNNNTNTRYINYSTESDYSICFN